MENNSDRMGFALIALSVVAFVLLAVNGPLKSTVDGFFNGFKDWQTATSSNVTYNLPAKNLWSDPYLSNVSRGYFSNDSIYEKITTGDVFSAKPDVVRNVYKVTATSHQWAYINRSSYLINPDASLFINKTWTVSAWVYVPDDYMPYFRIGYYDAASDGHGWSNGNRYKVKIADSHGDWKYVSATFSTDNVKQASVIFVAGLAGLPDNAYNNAYYYVGSVKLEEGPNSTILT